MDLLRKRNRIDFMGRLGVPGNGNMWDQVVVGDGGRETREKQLEIGVTWKPSTVETLWILKE